MSGYLDFVPRGIPSDPDKWEDYKDREFARIEQAAMIAGQHIPRDGAFEYMHRLIAWEEAVTKRGVLEAILDAAIEIEEAEATR